MLAAIKLNHNYNM